MVNITLRLLYPRRKNLGTLRTGGWVSPRTDMDHLEGQSLAVAAIQTPDSPVRRLVDMRTKSYPCVEIQRNGGDTYTHFSVNRI